MAVSWIRYVLYSGDRGAVMASQMTSAQIAAAIAESKRLIAANQVAQAAVKAAYGIQ